MTLYEQFQAFCPNASVLGLEPREEVPYFCTPKGAQIIGWAGVDGIHYCFVQGFGEMVFAVSPMNLPGEYVHPIARNFADLLGLLLACGSMDALEQAWGWDREQFDTYLRENPASGEQQALLALLREKLKVEPIVDPYGYLQELQQSFDYSRIPYSEDDEDPDENPQAEEPISPWRVTWEDERSASGPSGQEIPVQDTFRWGGECWHLPAVYCCSKGLVVDFCIQVDPEGVTAFLNQYRELDESTLSPIEQHILQQKNPLNVDFRLSLCLNGEKLSASSGCGMVWLADACLPEGEWQGHQDSGDWIRHYQLDPTRCWSFHRWYFPWVTQKPPVLRSLDLHLERDSVETLGTPFVTPAAGQSVFLSHPVTGQGYTLTVAEVEEQQLKQEMFRDPGLEYPLCLTAMTYTLDPDLPSRAFQLQDQSQGDRPRRKEPPVPGEPVAVSAAAIGIIGGADGPTAVLVGRQKAKVHTACSSLRFEPGTEITWMPIFRDKMLPDLDRTVELTP